MASHSLSLSYMRGESFMEFLKHASLMLFKKKKKKKPIECVLMVTAELNISGLSIISNAERTSMSKGNDPRP